MYDNGGNGISIVRENWGNIKINVYLRQMDKCDCCPIVINIVIYNLHMFFFYSLKLMDIQGYHIGMYVVGELKNQDYWQSARQMGKRFQMYLCPRHINKCFPIYNGLFQYACFSNLPTNMS